MIRVALKGMADGRFRTALTALAIVLGVAMVSGAFTLTDTMKKAADSLSTSAYSGTDAAVVARTAFKVDTGSGTFSPTVPASGRSGSSAPRGSATSSPSGRRRRRSST